MREHLVNAEFDLSLRPRWRGLGDHALDRRVTELGYHWLLGGDTEDSVLVPAPAPGSFLDYLAAKGIACAPATLDSSCRREARFAPFGWNRRAAELNQRYERPEEHPDLEVVRQVNGRCFAAALERELVDDPPTLGAFGDVDELEAALASLPASAAGWVVKSEHGNAAQGNRRLRSAGLEPADRRFVDSLLEEDDALLLEQWLPRRHDLCTTFELGAAGEVVGLNLHEMVNTADGAFIGALFEARSEVIAPWQEALTATAQAVARHLGDAGYFGPVCLDAFTWGDGDRERLRPLADLNARCHMSAPALRLWRGWGGDVTLYWRLFTTRKLRLPSSEHELDGELGADAFDPLCRAGVLIASPVRLADRAPHKLGVCFAAPSRHDAFELEARFRERFEP